MILPPNTTSVICKILEYFSPSNNFYLIVPYNLKIRQRYLMMFQECLCLLKLFLKVTLSKLHYLNKIILLEEYQCSDGSNVCVCVYSVSLGIREYQRLICN
jgi:hypothetical protein